MKLTTLLALVLSLFTVAAHADPERGSAAVLRETHAALAGRLAESPFGRSLLLESQQSGDRVQGAVYAVVDHRFDELASALDGTRQWCKVLILHLNVKDCRPTPSGGLAVFLGRKTPQPPEQAQRLDFDYRTVTRAEDFMETELQAASGPAGTRDYRIRLEAAPLDAKRSFVALSYSYGYGLAARIAVNTYLATAGSGKVGFTVVGTQPEKGPEYVGGLRGIVERNVMRYYLAIEAYLAALSVPPDARPEKSMRDWFAATERYPRQLHEIGRSEYLEMKRVEYRREALALRSEGLR